MFFNDFLYLQRTIDFYVRSGKADAIQTIFYVPYEFISNSDPKVDTYTVTSSTNTVEVTWLEPTTSPVSVSQSITRPANLSGFVPKNAKLFTYPYCFFNLTNNVGTECEYRYEDFTGNPLFDVTMALSPSMSIKCTARNYKTGGTDQTWGEGVMGGKTPQCSWTTDYYTNWLTQNAVNIGLSAATTLAQPFVGASPTTFGLVGAVTSIIGEHYRASMVPDQVHGNINSGDVSFSNNKCCFTIIPKCIKPEYARVIDDYFTMFGYKTNLLKVPNITGRSNWNYVETRNCNILGNIPSMDLETIKQMFNSGITLWHTTEYFLDYSRTNSII